MHVPLGIFRRGIKPKVDVFAPPFKIDTIPAIFTNPPEPPV